MSQRENIEAFLQHEEHLRMLAKNGEDGFMKEFMALKQQSMRYKTEKTYSTTEGERDYNIRKNRYKDILPFDYTRIVLPEVDDAEGSDYINANYIKGLDGKNVYVAAQGPLPHTVNDFWRLLWTTGVEIVIMACNEYESGKHKCEKYWPDENESKQFGSITITLIRQLRVTQDFMIRTLKVNCQGEERVMNQFHYTAWPDHGVPRTVQPIMDMIQLFREYSPNEDNPVVMHCSAGCGRTGTIICIDYVRALLRAGKIAEDFCLYDIIMEMRRQRPAIVQTRDQYELVHRAVAWLFRKELDLAPNPNDYDHLYENVKLQNEGPRMPPGAGNLSPDIRTTPPFKLSPKQRRHKDKEQDHGHNYVNHVIQGKGASCEGSPTPVKMLKPPSLPTKQQHQQQQPRETDNSDIIYANFQDKEILEDKGSDDAVLSPVLTPKQSPLAQERFESNYKNTLAAFKDFEVPSTQSKPAVKAVKPAKPTPRTVVSSRSLDLESSKPVPPAKPPLSEKPVISEKPLKVLSPTPRQQAKPALAGKKDTSGAGAGQGSGQSTGVRRRPTSEPVNHAQDKEKVQHIGTAQFQDAKNHLQAMLNQKSEAEGSKKESDVKKSKERRDSKGRPNSEPPKPPIAHVKPLTKPSARHQAYEEVSLPGKDSPSGGDKQDSAKGFQYQIQPVAMVKLQSHKDKVEAKSTNKPELPSQMHKRKTIDLSRPQHPDPSDNSSEYTYAKQPVSVVEKLKDAQSKPQLRTGKATAYAYAGPVTNEDSPNESSKPPQSLEDYSYASDVIIPVTPSNIKANIKKHQPEKRPLSNSQSSAYEVIQVSGPPSSQMSPDGQEEIPVFDKSLTECSRQELGIPRESVVSSSTSWASFTDEDYDYDDDDDAPPILPTKTPGAYEVIDVEGEESASGGGSKFSQLTNKLAQNSKALFKQITRSAPTPSGIRSSPQSSLSTSPQAAIVSDLNEIIKKTLRDYEPTYKEEPTMYQKYDISFQKRVPKPKTPPPVPNGWNKTDSHSTTTPV